MVRSILERTISVLYKNAMFLLGIVNYRHSAALILNGGSLKLDINSS